MRSEEVFAFLLQENTFPEERIFLIIKCLRHSLGVNLREMSNTQRYPMFDLEFALENHDAIILKTGYFQLWVFYKSHLRNSVAGKNV